MLCQLSLLLLLWLLLSVDFAEPTGVGLSHAAYE